MCFLSSRLRSLHPRTSVLEIRPRWHELLGGLPSLRRHGFFRLQKRVSLLTVENPVVFDNEEEFLKQETFVCSSGGFKDVYALLHLLILRSTSPSSQEIQVMFPQTWHLLCSYTLITHVYFAHFVTVRLRSGPCINDVWCCVALTSCL